MAPDGDGDRNRDSTGARRSRGFQLHLIGYGVVSAMLMLLNWLASPGQWWFPVFVVGWGAPLAVHCAWAMGLFDRSSGGD